MGAPLLSGALADRADEALDGISRALAALDPASLGDPGWAMGTSGIAVAHAYLHGRFPDRGHEDAAQRALRRTVELAAARPMTPWFVEGMAGIGWTLAHLTGGADDDGAGADKGVDATLLRVLDAAGPHPWELFYGLAGFVPYALERLPLPGARDVLERTARRLAAVAEAVDGGTCWRTLPECDPVGRHPAPYWNFGVAHGFPGAILVTAELVRRGVLALELRPILAGASAWLASQRVAGEKGARFRAWSDDDGAPARTAWCYGDPGIAWALLMAARALGDRSLASDAVAIAVDAAARSPSAGGVVDACLCHGAAGLAHLYHRMAMLEPAAPALRDAARSWFAHALDMRRADAPLGGFRSFWPIGTWNDQPGLLMGVSGVGLALVSAMDPDATGWDLPLLLSP